MTKRMYEAVRDKNGVIVRRESGSPVLTEVDWGPSRTKQSFKDEVDINNIISRFTAGGDLPEPTGGEFADVSNLGDFTSSMQFVASAVSKFEALPIDVRSRFATPNAFVEFVTNPANIKDVVKMGLAEIVERPVQLRPKAPAAAQGPAKPAPEPNPSGTTAKVP